MGDTDVIIESLLKRNEELHRQIVLLTEQNERLLAENRKLAEDNLKLQKRLARLEKNSTTSSKPPSSDITNQLDKSIAKKKKLKRDGQKGHKKHTRRKFTQEEIAETIVHKIWLSATFGAPALLIRQAARLA